MKSNYFYIALKTALAICLLFSINVSAQTTAGTTPINWLPFIRAIFLSDRSGQLNTDPEELNANLTGMQGTAFEEVLAVELAD